MTDPLGLMGGMGAIRGDLRPPPPTGANQPANGEFKQMLQEQIDAVNKLQTDAKQAIEDFSTGRSTDPATVLTATMKADAAFKLLLQVRNKVMEAYEEVKQVRV